MWSMLRACFSLPTALVLLPCASSCLPSHSLCKLPCINACCCITGSAISLFQLAGLACLMGTANCGCASLLKFWAMAASACMLSMLCQPNISKMLQLLHNTYGWAQLVSDKGVSTSVAHQQVRDTCKLTTQNCKQ